MDKKPNVFPSQSQSQTNTQPRELTEQERVAAYEAEKAQVTNQIYGGAQTPTNDANDSYNYLAQNNSLDAMRQRADHQLSLRNQGAVIQYPELAEKDGNEGTRKISYEESSRNQKTEEQMRLRDEALAKNKAATMKYHEQSEISMASLNNKPTPGQNMQQNNQNVPVNNYVPPVPPTTPPVTPPVNNYGESYGQNPSNINPYVFELSQPNYNAPFDVIPLPSQGKTYRSKKPSVRLSYMTTADENILTSPNLLQSGEFLEILMNRKILEPELRYKDLLVGDRNAIMIWIRATGYGEMYPVTLLDENGIPFETELNLNDLKTRNFGVEPDEEGLFDFTFKLSKTKVKFKFLTCGDVDGIDRLVAKEKENNIPVDNTSIYTLERMIVEVHGDRDRNIIRDFANSIRIKDAKDFNEYTDKIECGVDLNITVGTPGGGSVNTFLPLNINFFWPNIRI